MADRATSSGTTRHYSNQGGRPGRRDSAGDYKLIQFFEDNPAGIVRLKKDVVKVAISSRKSRIWPGI